MKVNSTITRLGVLLLMLLWQQLALAQNQIVVPSITTDPYCAGSTVSFTFQSASAATGKFDNPCAGQTFNYTAEIGTYDSGTLTFTSIAQIATGTTTLNNLTTGNNPRIPLTTVNYTIPSTLPTGNNYRVRVTVSNSCFGTGTTNALSNNSFTIRALPTLSSVALSGSTCEGLNSTVTLNGLVPSSGANNLSVAYTIGGNAGPGSPLTETSNASGVATFTLTNQLANNGQTLAITGITQNYTAAPAGTCATTFSTGNTVALTVNSTPTVTLTSSSISGCQGATAPLAYSATTGTPNRYSIDFDAAAETAGFVDIPNTTVLPVSPINVSIAGAIAANTYNATLTVRRSDSGNCTSQGYPITIIVNQSPNAGTISGPTAVCVGSTISLGSSGDAGGTWSSSSDAVAIVDANGVVTGVTNGSVTITYSVTNGNCTTSTTASVTVNAKPTITLAAIPAQCEYQTANLSATSGFAAYSWGYTTSNELPANGAFDSNPTPPSTIYTSTANAIGFVPNDNGAYTITVSVTNGSCTNQATRVFASRAKPNIAITFDPVSSPVRTYCANEVITLSVNVITHPSYEWSIDSPSKGVFGSTGASPTASNTLTFGDNTTSLSITATVTLSATATNSCSNTATTTIRIKPRPVVSISPSSPETCAGQPITLTAAGGSTYSWGSSGVFTSTTNQVTLTGANAAGGYSVSVTATNTSSCTSSASATVTIKASPTVSLSNTNVCADATKLFVPTVSNDVTTYAWMTDAGLFDDTQLANPTLTANSNAGFYGASVTVSNSNSCTASASASVTVNELPVATVDDEEVCAGSTVMLSATVSTGVTLPLSAPSAEAFAWSSAAGTFSPQSATPTLTATAAPGVYTVTLSYTNSNGCTASATASLTINARPTLSTASVTVTVASCANATNGAIAITPSGGDGNYTYSWTRNGSPSFSNATNNPTNLAPGTYNVTVTDGNGCTVTRSIVVGIDPSINIVPVIQNLSCNGDGTGSINLTVNGITPTGYSWTRNGSPFSGGSSISGLSAGTYNVTVTDGFCNVTGSYQVTQPAVLGASLNLVKLACAGNNGIISLTISGGTGPKSYNFSGPTSISPASVSNGTYNFSGLAAGTYNVTVTDANSCETYSSVIVPSSGSTPLNIIFPGSLCNGQSFQLSTNYTGFPGVRYRWAGPSGFSSTSATPTVTLGTATSGVYSVSATITGCTAIVSALTTVTTRGLPNVGNITVVGRTYNTTTNTFNVCRNAPFTFNLVGAAGDNYVWRGPSGSGFSTTTASPSVVVPSATSAQQGQYTISARYAGCTQFNHKVINIQVVSCAIRLATGDFDTESNGIVVKVSPNPVDGVAVVDVSLNSPSAIQLKVLQSGSGKVEYATEAREVQSTHRMEVDMSRMTVGQYLFVVESADGIKTEKVIKVAKKE